MSYYPHNLRAVVLLVLLGYVLIPNSLHAQANAQSDPEIENRRSFLASQNKLNKAIEIESLFKGKGTSEKFALSQFLLQLQTLHLAIEGYSAPQLNRLRSHGVDFLEMIAKTPDKRTLAEKAALSGVAVLAKVERIYDSLEPADGYRSSVVLHVNQVLRGEIESDELVLRRLSGLNKDGLRGINYAELDLEVGETYLFFLSHNKYRFLLAYPGIGADEVGITPDQALHNYYIEVYHAIPVDNINDSQSRIVLNEVKRIDGLIKSARQ